MYLNNAYFGKWCLGVEDASQSILELLLVG